MEDINTKSRERKTELTESAAYELYSAARWAQGFSIYLIVLAAIMTLSFFTTLYTLITTELVPPQIIGTVLIIGFMFPFIIIMAFLLLKFSNKTKNALRLNSDSDFYLGFKALKRYFSWSLIISLSITSITILVSIVSIIAFSINQ